MDFMRVLLLLVLLCVAQAAGETEVDLGAPPESGIELLREGFHWGAYDWPEVASGDKWWGLYRMDDGSIHMLETTITVTEELEVCINETMPYVVIDQENECLFLVRGSDHFKEGPVTTIYDWKSNFSLLDDTVRGHSRKGLLPADTVNVTVPAGHRYIIYALGNVEQHTIINNYSLNIMNRKDWGTKGNSQTLLTVETTSIFMTLPEIHWIGDLDHDGHLDILVDARPYPGQLLVLYLSTEAKDEEIVSMAAKLQIPGC